MAKTAVTVALLAALTDILHRQWVTPSEGGGAAEPAETVAIPTPQPVGTLPQPPVIPVTPAPQRKAAVAAVPSAGEEWAKIQDSADRRGLEAFLARHGKSRYAENALFALGRLELMELTAKADVEGLRAFVARHEKNRNMSDWVYAARERIPLMEHEREEAALRLIPGKLGDAFAKQDMAAVRALIPDLAGAESNAIAKMFERCKSVELAWGRGGAYLARGKQVAEINQELEVRVVTEEGDALRARRDWVRVDVEKVNGEWVVRKARWHRGGKGNFTAFDMPELP